MVDSLSIVLSVFPYGLVYGVLAVKSGLTAFEALLSSLIVLAGASQFISLPLFAAGVSPWVIIGTVFIVNIRHFIMGAAISGKIKEPEVFPRLIASYFLVDGTFALATAAWDTKRTDSARDYLIGSGIVIGTSWVVSTLMGAVFGNLLGDPTHLGLDFAVAAAFIGLLIPQVKGKPEIVVMLWSALFSVFFYLFIPGNWYILLGSILGAVTGALVTHDED
jgi:4-azaleucine resistance transporter AzlC